MSTAEVRHPLTYNLAKWYSYGLAASFLLYGGVKLILSVLDRNYTDMVNPFVSLAIGALVVAVALGYRDLKEWGWYGLVAINSLAGLGTVFGLAQIDNAILLVLSLSALVCLLIPSTRTHIFGRS
jgi:hypothetical protein